MKNMRPMIPNATCLLITFISFLISSGDCVKESNDIEDFKAMMQQIFIRELGEDLRRKVESISNEGVYLKKTNKEIEAMIQSRLNNEERQRMKKAFRAITGPAKQFARERAKGKPVKLTRSSQFKTTAKPPKKPHQNTAKTSSKTDNVKPAKNQKNKEEF